MADEHHIMTNSKTTYLLLARLEGADLALIEKNIAASYEYEKISTKAFLIFGDYAPDATLHRLAKGLNPDTPIYLYSLMNPISLDDLR